GIRHCPWRVIRHEVCVHFRLRRCGDKTDPEALPANSFEFAKVLCEDPSNSPRPTAIGLLAKLAALRQCLGATGAPARRPDYQCAVDTLSIVAVDQRNRYGIGISTPKARLLVGRVGAKRRGGGRAAIRRWTPTPSPSPQGGGEQTECAAWKCSKNNRHS